MRISMSLRFPRPAWQGMMQLIHRGEHPSASYGMFLAIIDRNPSDMNCVYSTLRYIITHAIRHNVAPIMTFDQPLWLKAVIIQASVSPDNGIRSIVVLLGGFHTQMSMLGVIGGIMAGSGLQEVLECVYASNTVGHMLSGKAIARTLRGHILVSVALNVTLTSKVFGIPLPGTQQVIEQEELEYATTAPDHQSKQSDPPEADENPGTRPTYNTSQTQ